MIEAIANRQSPIINQEGHVEIKEPENPVHRDYLCGNTAISRNSLGGHHLNGKYIPIRTG